MIASGTDSARGTGNRKEHVGAEQHEPAGYIHEGSIDSMVGWTGESSDVLDRRHRPEDEIPASWTESEHDEEPTGSEQHAGDHQPEGSFSYPELMGQIVVDKEGIMTFATRMNDYKRIFTFRYVTHHDYPI